MCEGWECLCKRSFQNYAVVMKISALMRGYDTGDFAFPCFSCDFIPVVSGSDQEKKNLIHGRKCQRERALSAYKSLSLMTCFTLLCVTALFSLQALVPSTRGDSMQPNENQQKYYRNVPAFPSCKANNLSFLLQQERFR